MKSHESATTVRTIDRSTGWGFYRNQNSYSEAPRMNTYKVFSVTNGLVKGDRRKPNPISFSSAYYTAGTGRQVVSAVRNGTEYIHPSWVDKQGGSERANFPILEEATTVSPFSGYAASKGWGSPDSTSQVRDRALAKVYEELRSGPNLIVDLAEGGSTLRMLKGTLRVRTLLKDFFRELVIPRKLRGKSSGQARLDYITGKWLEARYGWVPAVNTVYDAFEQLHRDFESEIVTVRARSSMKREFAELQDWSGFNPAAYVQAPCSGKRVTAWKISKSHRCEYQIRFKPQGANLWDWTSLSPASIAWELTPLSFVADWFMTIGEYLETMENSALYRAYFESGYRTDTFRGTVSKEDTFWATSSASVYPNSSFVRSHHYESKGAGFTRSIKDRVVLPSLPFPEGIHLKVNVNAKRQLDAAALIHQLVGRRFR